MGFIGGVFFLLVVGAVGFTLIKLLYLPVANYTLGAAAERERLSQAQTQFMMSDLFSLVLLMQVALAAVVAYVPRESYGLFYLFFVFAMAATTALWWGTMRMVSRAGVRQVGRRTLFVTLIAPGTLGILILSGPLVFYLGKQAWLYSSDVRGALLREYFGGWELASLAYLLSIPLQMWLLKEGTTWALDDPYSRQLAAEALARKQAAEDAAQIIVAELVQEEEQAAEVAARELAELDLNNIREERG